MKWLFAAATMAMLTACGVDGEPLRPTYATSVGIGSGGVSVGTRVGARKGPFNVGIGLGL